MKGEPYQRAPYPATWARMHGKGRVFYTAIGDRPENWSNTFFLNLLGGGIRWSIGDAKASLTKNLAQATPGLRRDSAEASCQDIAIRLRTDRKYLRSNLTGTPRVRLNLGIVRVIHEDVSSDGGIAGSWRLRAPKPIAPTRLSRKLLLPWAASTGFMPSIAWCSRASTMRAAISRNSRAAKPETPC